MKAINWARSIFKSQGEEAVNPKEIIFQNEFDEFREKSVLLGREFKIEWEDRFPCLDDNTGETGFDRHYVYHTAWAARKVINFNSVEHYDISSCLYFCSILSASVKVNFYDYRPADLKLTNLKSEAADLLKLPFKDDSIQSLSCMHVIEHIGLGRYGDPLDPIGDVKAINELIRVLKPGGKLLFVVPVGEPRICFNAHRIYSYFQIVELFKDLKLIEFSLVPDKKETGGLILNPKIELVNSQKYGCGCFEFEK
jgi:SAM-dependent methyltransferase